jgi:hypothetical protein
MAAPRESYQAGNLVVITVDIEDCPLVEFPLTELFDITTLTVVENYLDVLRDYVTQVLEDTTWLDNQSTLRLLRARLGVYHRRNEDGLCISMRKPALQRRITQTLRGCDKIGGVHRPVIEVPIFIRFLRPEVNLPCKTSFPLAIPRSPCEEETIPTFLLADKEEVLYGSSGITTSDFPLLHTPADDPSPERLPVNDGPAPFVDHLYDSTLPAYLRIAILMPSPHGFPLQVSGAGVQARPSLPSLLTKYQPIDRGRRCHFTTRLL